MEPLLRGRFAPSPSGRMHLGNVFTALLAWLSVRSAGGTLVLRMEDLDPDRCREEYAQVLAEGLQVMDLPATALAMENHIPVMIFALADPKNILRVVMGERIGTIVEEELNHE